MTNEPVMIWTTIGALIGSVLAWLVPDMPNDVAQNIVTVVALVGPVVAGAFYARSKVDGPNTAQDKDAEIEALKMSRRSGIGVKDE